MCNNQAGVKGLIRTCTWSCDPCGSVWMCMVTVWFCVIHAYSSLYCVLLDATGHNYIWWMTQTRPAFFFFFFLILRLLEIISNYGSVCNLECEVFLLWIHLRHETLTINEAEPRHSRCICFFTSHLGVFSFSRGLRPIELHKKVNHFHSRLSLHIHFLSLNFILQLVCPLYIPI